MAQQLSVGFPHRLKVFAMQPNSSVTVPTGTQNEEEGTWTPNTVPELTSTDTIYDDLADVQDKGVVLTFDQNRTPIETADAVAFLADESKIDDIKVGMTVEVTWKPGKTSLGRVMRVVRLDGSLLLKNL